MQLQSKVQGTPFNDKAIWRAVKFGAKKMLGRFGAYVWTTAWQSFRKRKAISEPGSPPNAHVMSWRKLIAFHATDEVVYIGPIRLSDKFGMATRTLELGGEVEIPGHRNHSARRAFYRARPFMQPAFDAELAKVPQLLKNFVPNDVPGGSAQ